MNEKVLLVVDMEGCCGIYDLKAREECKKKMELEVDFIISVLNKLGHNDISLLDCHNDGTTLGEYCMNKGIPFINHLWSLNKAVKYSCAFLVGFHGKADTDGYFPHTIRQDIKSMSLGKEIIGEVALVINWLAFFNIPVVYISGDQTIEHELRHYQGVFCVTKSKGTYESNLEEKTTQIEQSIILSLNCPRMVRYIDQQIRIDLRNPNYCVFIPREEFTCKENAIYFEDTVSLVQNLQLFCSYLNIAARYHSLRIGRLVEKLRQINCELLHQDKRAKKLLLMNNMHELTDDDFIYLTQLTYSLKGKS